MHVMVSFSQTVMADGHSAVQLITQLHDYLIQLDDLNDSQKSAIFERLAVSANIAIFE